MKRQVYDSPPIDFTLERRNYRKGTNDVLYVSEREGLDAVSAREYLKLIKNESPLLRLSSSFRTSLNLVPSRNLILDINRDEVLRKGIIPEGMEDLIIDQMNIRVKGNYMTKGGMMLLDMIVTNNWERPIYFNNTSLATIGFDLSNHVVMEGLTYRLLPVQKPQNVEELVNTDIAYRNAMEKFAFRGMNNPDNYFDDEFRRFTSNHRSALNSITIALLEEDDVERARDIQMLSLEAFPHEAIPYDLASGQSVPLLFEIGEEEYALHIIDEISHRAIQMLDFYTQRDRPLDREAMISGEMLKYFVPLLRERGFEERALRIQNEMNRIFGQADDPRLRTK